MKTKNVVVFLFAMLCLLLPGHAEAESGYAVNKIRDLALIYQGGRHRIPWTVDQIEPYVVHKFADGHKEWLFDGYLFLEFADGMECDYVAGYGKRAARKDDWERLMNRIFEKGKALDALNTCIENQKRELGDPGFKHKIVLTVPIPFQNQKDWGTLGSRKLDFSKTADAKRACQWYIDEVTKRFKKAGLNNLELTGIYWVAEDTGRTFEGLPRQISTYVHRKGLEFVWIPYFKAKGYNNWRNLGFDIAYHQPNYFFNKSVPESRIDEACKIARENGMAMEFECDQRALLQNKDSYFDRMEAYLDGFERNGVFDRSAIAYYTDSHLLLDFINNPHPRHQAIMDRLARHIADRRKIPSLIPRR